MNDKEKEALLRKTIETFGEIHQKNKAVEELSELAKELIKDVNNDLRHENEDYLQRISDEMADVEIMMEQLKLIYCNSGLVSAYKAFKLDRLRRTVADEVDKING